MHVTFSGVDEIGRDIATIKLQALNDLQLIMQSFAILCGNDNNIVNINK